jgi:hypothetical protein
MYFISPSTQKPTASKRFILEQRRPRVIGLDLQVATSAVGNRASYCLCPASPGPKRLFLTPKKDIASTRRVCFD